VDTFGISELEAYQKILDRRTPYYPLRRRYSCEINHYSERAGPFVGEDKRIEMYGNIRGLLNKRRIDVKNASSFGQYHSNLHLSSNLMMGYIEPVASGIGVTGICLPSNTNLESFTSVFALRELLENSLIGQAVIGFPLLAYRLVGLNRTREYYKSVEIVAGILDPYLEQTVLLPDNRIFDIKSGLSAIISPHVGDQCAREKYPFDNTFRYMETLMYATDVLIPGMCFGKNPLVVADFLQYETVDAAKSSAKAVGTDVGAILLTTLLPLDGTKASRSAELAGKNREVIIDPSDIEGSKRRIIDATTRAGVPEVCPAFNASFVLMDRDTSSHEYSRCAGNDEPDCQSCKDIMSESVSKRLRQLKDDTDKALRPYGYIRDDLIENSFRRIKLRPVKDFIQNVVAYDS
jgi:hypothetical protein